MDLIAAFKERLAEEAGELKVTHSEPLADGLVVQFEVTDWPWVAEEADYLYHRDDQSHSVEYGLEDEGHWHLAYAIRTSRWDEAVDLPATISGLCWLGENAPPPEALARIRDAYDAELSAGIQHDLIAAEMLVRSLSPAARRNALPLIAQHFQTLFEVCS